MNLFPKPKFRIFLFLLFIFIFGFFHSSCNYESQIETDTAFNQNRALGYIEKQLSFGYRIPGSQASRETASFIKNVLEQNGWTVTFQDFVFDSVTVRNIIAKRDDSSPNIILGAHYDTRKISDQEKMKEKQTLPVMGANDGASGTALLLELSNHPEIFDKNVCLVFFDAEDQGRINGWPWSLGAEYFANHLSELPQAVVIVDMIGDRDLQIYKEKNSDKLLSDEIWSTADQMGYKDFFIDQPKYAMIDDHAPFLNLGIPSALLIDFDYPYWHTNEDTLDKVSGTSLGMVGDVLLKWISDFH